MQRPTPPPSLRHAPPALSALVATLLAAVALPVMANDHDDDRGGEQAREGSQQPVADSWITAKVKADLLLTEETKGLDINVSTRDGVVTLAGRLDTAAQVEKAVAIARAIDGVKSVDATTLTVKPRG